MPKNHLRIELLTKLGDFLLLSLNAVQHLVPESFPNSREADIIGDRDMIRIFGFRFFLFLSFVFLGPHPRHMEG